MMSSKDSKCYTKLLTSYFKPRDSHKKGKSYKNSLSEEKGASTTGVNYYQLKTTVFTLNSLDCSLSFF
ncbi:hypothetical protein RK659_05675 [Streptococcus pneumoniae]|nr:hypothetical protein [Streptococcus pneumoniae]MBW5051400.1 hypothetical protein [Streptococcus pneumoniae]MDG7072061.1 hypothetical protein [Streptococcus pneumoniae]MDG7077210.1 hypothetical protein [Streptococcus pneumoniae]MDG7079236.1 hypothetical protein [Streptococcus pneumoniae]MDG7124193.1 hypothetical protein [Streptococcus pneumoniae]